MLSIESCPLPENALLNEYVRLGAYTDCFRTDLDAEVTHAAFVRAFYTTPLFKLERLILTWLLSKPSTDDEALQLAAGTTDSFAAWQVERRCTDQLLLTDFAGRTRSWLMIEANGKAVTRLYFGSAVTTPGEPKQSNQRHGPGFSLLIGFHRVYSVLLLYSARKRLQHKPRGSNNPS